MSIKYTDYLVMLAVFLASLTVVLTVAAAVYLLIGYGLAYSLSLLGLIEFSHEVALGATLLTFIVVILYQYFVDGEAVLELDFEA